jgi:uncharacterized protein YyaL (SSP411 family)/aryl-alcohol dehydrogenase-like predicted oxidoreductase
MTDPAATRRQNRLANATSPYLLQHAHNPVDWYPWGEEALERARAEDKPILLSIGYSACHWCHVMERESFENPKIAALMNESFVCIKVDREERPDLDDIYMAATLAMNHGQGGWPMTVFLTPAQEPFFAGTYFPPEDGYGRPGFASLLKRIAELWRTSRATLVAQGSEMARHLQEATRRAPSGMVGEGELQRALEQLAEDFDERHAGFGPAPKFPPSGALSLLLRAHRRFGDERAIHMVRRTLMAMARGGMYDQVGGGFHRYSVDERWLVPHFEKMLYDNALLARAYLEGWQAARDPFFQRIATEILDYVLREMTDAEGGFYSATDADSEGEEGRFFVWTPESVEAALGDAELARRFCEAYDVTARGNWEGNSIPNLRYELSAVAARLGLTPDDLEASLAEARLKLYAARFQRVPPGLDDKVLTAWNGLMIGAFAEGYRVLSDPRYLAAGRKAADFCLRALRKDDGRLLRTWRRGVAHIDAYLEDYAFLAAGLLDLYEAGGEPRDLEAAEALTAHVLSDFAAEGGGFYATATGHERLLVRPREGHDGAIPAANAVAAEVLARLSHHLDRKAWSEEAGRAVRAYGRAVARQPRAFARTLAVVDFLLDGPTELAFVGERDATLPLRREAGPVYLPNRIVAHVDPAHGPSKLPLLAGKALVGGRAALYVCRDYACQQPVTDPAAVAAALEAGTRAQPAAAIAIPRLAGRATPEATAAHAARQPFAAHGTTRLGKTGLTVSRLGFGGYRIDDESPEHRAALEAALTGGVNLVDTSSNYTDGASERLVGQVLDGLVRAGRVRREEVVVVTKAGYMQGENLERAEQRREEGRPFPEVVEYARGLWHCLHPEFLADQLDRSRERLQLDVVDVLLLHNPEYYLADAHERSRGTLEARRDEFYTRLQQAFAWLETQVAAGTIRAYGVSSNTVTRPAHDPEATSLARMLEAARAAGGAGHAFHVLQLPLNLLEGAAASEQNTAGLTVLELAKQNDVAVLVNRPLNAIADEELLRLSEATLDEEAAPDPDLQSDLVHALEEEFRRDVASRLQAAEGSVPPAEFFRWGTELRAIRHHLRGLDHWRQLEAQRVLPRVQQVLQALDDHLSGEIAETWYAWRARYLPELQRLLSGVAQEAAQISHVRLAPIRESLRAQLPAELRDETLSRQALAVVASLPGVTSVLVGMRRPDYVADALGVLSRPPLPEPVRILGTIPRASHD